MLNDMLKYTLKRVGMALLTLLIITFLLFVLFRIMPGNPFPSMIDYRYKDSKARHSP